MRWCGGCECGGAPAQRQNSSKLHWCVHIEDKGHHKESEMIFVSLCGVSQGATVIVVCEHTAAATSAGSKRRNKARANLGQANPREVVAVEKLSRCVSAGS